MDAKKLTELQKNATEIRMGIIEGVHAAGAGHPGGSLSIADLMAYLYFAEMKVDPKDPKNPDRDRLVLSKGHAAPALYATLALKGYFPVEDLKTLRQANSHLQGHPDMKKTPGVDMTSGSLGQGISAACGMALCAKLDKKDYRVYAIVGDGESEEGQVWEAIMFAAHNKLDNLCIIIDYNGLQIDGAIHEIVSPAPYEEKIAAFGCHPITIDAHDLLAIEAAVEEAKTVKERPTVIVAKSVKGKGVSFMENQVKWHGSAPNDEQYAQAMAELNAALAAL